MSTRTRPPRLAVEALERREVPSVVIDEHFDSTTAGALPAGWAQYTSDGTNHYAADAAPANRPSGTQGLAFSTTNSSATGRAWSTTAAGPDATVSGTVYLNSLAQTRVIGRGSNLGTPTPTYYAATITRGYSVVSLVKVTGGSETTVATVTSAGYYSSDWATVTLDLDGSALKVKVQRRDTGQYLNASGQWVADGSGNTWALTATDTGITTGSTAGVSRLPVPQADATTGYVDDFKVVTPDAPPPGGGTYTQDFNGVSSGLPAGWDRWASNGGTPFGVAAPSATVYARSGNAMAYTSPSTVSGRTWYTTAQPAKVAAAADVYLNNPTGSLVFARGSNLATATPTYYAVTINRGYLNLGLQKVVGGVPTTLPGTTLVSPDYVSEKWVRVTLDLDGDVVRARVQRLDTNQYLVDADANGTGEWQAAEGWAVTATGQTDIPAGGLVGVARQTGNANTSSFDNFSVTGAAPAENVIEVSQASFNAKVAAHSKRVYVLDEADHTYRLTENITANDTAFVVAAAGVVLDLNGKTLTYNNRAAPQVDPDLGSSTNPLEAFNGGFEVPVSPTDAGPKQWDVTGAPGATRVSTTTAPFGPFMFDDWMLRLNLTSTNPTQSILSGWIELPAGAETREYATVQTTASTGSKVKMTVRILDAAGNPLPQVEGGMPARVVDGGNLKRGNIPPTSVNPPAGTTRVRVKLDFELEAGAPNQLVDLDYVDFRASREFGVAMSTDSSAPFHFPAHANVTGRTAAANFRLTDSSPGQAGLILQGAGRAIDGHSVVLGGGATSGTMTVEDVTTRVTGVNSVNVFGKSAANATIRGSTFQSEVDNVTRRTAVYAALYFLNSSKELTIADNLIEDYPQTGIYINRHAGNNDHVSITGNTIRQDGLVSNSYGLVIDGLTKFKVLDNTIQPINGRGILLDNTGHLPPPNQDGEFARNVVESRQTANLEYPTLASETWDAIEAIGLRIRDYTGNFNDLQFTDNTFSAETGSANQTWLASGLRMSLYGSTPSDITFTGNTFRGVVKSDNTAYFASAASVTQVPAGRAPVFTDNTFEGNHRLLNFTDDDAGAGSPVIDGVEFTGNTYRRLTATDVPGASDRTDDPVAKNAFRTVVVGEFESYPVRNITLAGEKFHSSIPAGATFRTPALMGTGVKTNIRTVWLVTVPVVNSSGQPVVGATVRFTDQFGQFTEAVTDSNGRATVRVTNTIYAGGVASDNRGPFTLSVRVGTTTTPISGTYTFDDLAGDHLRTVGQVTV